MKQIEMDLWNSFALSIRIHRENNWFPQTFTLMEEAVLVLMEEEFYTRLEPIYDRARKDLPGMFRRERTTILVPDSTIYIVVYAYEKLLP